MDNNIISRSKSKVKISSFQEVGILIALVVLCIALSIASPFFLQKDNILNVLRQISVVGILAVGEAFIIISGAIDLSVGSLLGLGGVMTAYFTMIGVNPFLAAVLGLAVGGLGGFINGILVTKAKINSFIVTLGMLSVARGITLLITGGMPISFESPIAFLGNGYIRSVPVSVIVMFLIIGLGHIFATKTIMGRNIFAIGNNEKAAELSGIAVEKLRLIVFTLMGILAALSGIILAGNLLSADPTSGTGYELDVIAAVVIGGASLAGGQGSIFGVLIGAALMGVLRNGFVLLGISAYWQIVTIGIVIVAAVGLDQLRKK
ncbi:ABC transporter permease [Moorella sp. ACPs]|uniref:ABC transporter permease n=1 Tax=Neomoorella carbonis TaxID=3062783 RepID=UPI00324F4F22